MLNIPIAVQDALRDGTMRKNYKMNVGSWGDGYDYQFNKEITPSFGNYTLVGGFNYKIVAHLPSKLNYIHVSYFDEYMSPVEYDVSAVADGSDTYCIIDLSDITTDVQVDLNVFTVSGYESGPYDLCLYSEAIVWNVEYSIENDELVSESVKIDERMVTGKNLKFGLCEGSVLEFQYFNHPNLNGKDIQVYLSAEYVDTDGEVKWYDIPMGYYTVDQCPMQWDTGIFKVTAYNKLKSKYLDEKANKQIVDYVTTNPNNNVNIILNHLLDNFSIEPRYDDFTLYHTTPSVVNSQSVYDETPSAAYYLEILKPNTQYTEAFELAFMCVSISTTVLSNDVFYRLRLNCKSLYDLIYGEILEKYGDYIGIYYNGKTVREIIEESLNSRIKSIITDGRGTTYNINEHHDEIDFKTDFGNSNGGHIVLTIPTVWKIGPRYNLIPYTYTQTERSNGERIAINVFDAKNGINAEKLADNETNNISFTLQEVKDLPDVTLRELQSAVYEVNCQYGQMDRKTDLFTGVELNSGGLYPADTLYPDDALYPSGPSLHPFPSTYQKLWTDTVGEQSFRYLIITYKAIENGEEVDKTLQRTVNTYGTTNYNMSDNWLFRNLVWTAEDVGAYADAMVLKMKDVRWFPFELWCAGLPYIETGDAIEITDRQGNTHTSYVLTRTLEGIHNLQDTFINGELDVF